MTAHNEPTDPELMRRVSRGEVDALDVLFARHHRRLYGFLARLTGDRYAADDLVQDVFLRLLQYRSSFRSDRELIPWLFTIARNLAHDRHARAGNAIPLDDRDFASTDDVPPLDHLIRAEEHDQLARALAALPVHEREVLLLHGVESLTHRQLAAVLGCSEGAARVRVHRALAALKRQWHATVGDSV